MRRFASIASGLFACVTGCGDDGVHHLPDAPAADDAGIDAPVAGTVNITTNVRCCDLAPGTAQAGVRVIVTGRNNAVGATAMTDAQGKASVAVHAGDSVTAVYPEDVPNLRTRLTTIAGVKPGDNLTFGDAYWVPPATGVDGQLNVSWPAVTGANYYEVYTPCGSYFAGSATTTATIPLSAYCQTATAPIVFVAHDNNGLIVATSYLPAAPFTPGTLPAITWTPVTPSYAVSVSGLDAAINQVYLSSGVTFPSQITIANGDYPTITAGAGTLSFAIPAGAQRAYGSMDLRRNGTRGRQTYMKAGAASAAFAAPTMPWLTGLAASPGDVQAVWLQTAGTYDAATLRFNWSHSVAVETHYFDWNVILPPGVTSLNIGTPPAELAPYLPATTDDLGSDLVLVDLASATGYDALRALPEGRIMNPEAAVRAGDETAASVSSFDGGEGFAAR